MLVQETITPSKPQADAASPAPGQLRGAGDTREPARKAVRERDEPTLPDQGAEPEEQAASEKSSRARLSLDPELHRVFVEIVDPKTGDVITRFPPEQIANHIDSVLEQTGQETNLEDSGLIFDQSV